MESEDPHLGNQHTESAEPIAAFVFLGRRLPKYLTLNIRKFIQNWPNVKVLLIVDNPKSVPRAISSRIEVIRYSRSPETSAALTGLKLNPRFRSGFWIKTLERLIALEAGHSEYPSRRLLHIEGDVVILPGFPWDSLSEFGDLSWLRLTEDEDIAALVLTRNAAETSWLVRNIISVAQKDNSTSDMRALKAVAKSNPEKVTYLPSSPSDSLSESIGVFDALPLGLWLFGVDPKNLAGKIRNHHTDPRHLQSFLGWRVQGTDNGGLEVSNGSKNIRVNSLHLHSKSLRVLRAKNIAGLAEVGGREKSSWSTVAFGYWLLEQAREVFSPHGLRAIRRRLLGRY